MGKMVYAFGDHAHAALFLHVLAQMHACTKDSMQSTLNRQLHVLIAIVEDGAERIHQSLQFRYTVAVCLCGWPHSCQKQSLSASAH